MMTRHALDHLVRIGRPEDDHPRHGAERRQMLDRLMGGPILAQVDGIVGPDEDRRHLHQRADPERAAAM